MTKEETETKLRELGYVHRQLQKTLELVQKENQELEIELQTLSIENEKLEKTNSALINLASII